MAIQPGPVTLCAHRACKQPAVLHGVCADHLVNTLAAGYRAVMSVPDARMVVHLSARYGAA